MKISHSSPALLKGLFFIFVCFIASNALYAQNGVIKGKVTEKKNNQPIIGATIFLEQTKQGTTTDFDGNYSLDNIAPGLYTVTVSYLGFETISEFEIEIQRNRPTNLDFALVDSGVTLDAVEIKAAAFRKTSESPLSLRNIGVSEIKRNPGGNRDISRVIQSLPGVTSTASFRNDLIIRGGAPNENRFFIDDVEIPAINHFATQGASGGPAGIINVDFIREVDFFSGAFPVSRGNSLSSVFNFKFKDGRDDRLGSTLTVGATDIGATFEGPLSNKTTFLFSARRSYLQFLFKALELPFLPTYNDFNAKVKYKINNKSELTFIGIGAIDDFLLNKDANKTEAQQFILGFLPITTQWNYTNGVVYKRFNEKGFTNYVISRSMLNNASSKYKDNDESSAENLVLSYKSQEIENKIRIENFKISNNISFMYGAGYEYVRYNVSTFRKIFATNGPQDVNFSNAIDLHKYNFFGNASKKFFANKLEVNVGLRFDANSYSADMNNPFDQISPRLALSYALTDKLLLNGNVGRYFQLPPFTVLGYKENGILKNKENNVKYIKADHYVAGIEYNLSTSSRITIEAYYKKYGNYPFLLRDQISLANVGGDFGVIGNEPVISVSSGRTYGVEWMYQQRLYKGFYGILAYTFGKSEFTNSIPNSYTPSSWDSRHIVNLTLGKRFGNNWEIGLKGRLQTGLPITPFSEDSNLAVNWDRNFTGYPDFNRINSLRQGAFRAVDARLDKKWFFKGWDLNVYLDLQNATAATISNDILILDRPLDDNGKPIGGPIIINPDAPISEQRYKTKRVENKNGTLVPTLGVVVTL